MTARVLPDVEWRDADGLKRVIAALADDHGGPRIVGGAVRDSLLGIAVTDVDLATILHPDAVIDRLEAARIKAVPTGLDHGTVTAVADGKNYEITTLRRDVATDGRRATVAFATDWREDAARRDFTINALYADPNTGEIFDYFDGLADLESGTIRFIGDADQRIAEDFLRILRYFRFLARFPALPGPWLPWKSSSTWRNSARCSPARFFGWTCETTRCRSCEFVGCPIVLIADLCSVGNP